MHFCCITIQEGEATQLLLLALYFDLIYFPAVDKSLLLHPLVFLVPGERSEQDSFLLLRLQQK